MKLLTTGGGENRIVFNDSFPRLMSGDWGKLNIMAIIIERTVFGL